MRRERAWCIGAVAALALVALIAGGASQAQGAGTVQGRVQNAAGEPLAGAAVSLSPGGSEGTSAANGSFRLVAEPGNYLVRATFANRSVEQAVQVREGNVTEVLLVVPGPAAPGGLDPFPFAFLGAAMLAVIIGGFYVNKRMSETGVEFDKSVLGGVSARKPFRRRRKPKAPPPSP